MIFYDTFELSELYSTKNLLLKSSINQYETAK